MEITPPLVEKSSSSPRKSPSIQPQPSLVVPGNGSLGASSGPGRRASFRPQLSRRNSNASFSGNFEEGADFREHVSYHVIESSLGELEELSNDIEGTSIYALRADNIQTWVYKIRASMKSIRASIDGKSAKAMPTTQSFNGGKASVASPHILGHKHHQSTVSHATRDGGANAAGGPGMSIVAPFVSGALHMLIDSLAAHLSAEYATCYLFSQKVGELVLACSVGKRLDRPGTLRLSATSGIEGMVLQTGIGINVSHAHSEKEFNEHQDPIGASRTKSELVFPLFKPGCSTHTFGVVQLCNKDGGEAFTQQDEARVAECASFVAMLIHKYPADITNSVVFDPALCASSQSPMKADPALSGLGNFPLVNDAPRHAQLVFRTARAGHVRKSEVLRSGAKLSSAPTITEALSHVQQVNDAWRNSVLLNAELEKEIARLNDALTVAKRESSRLTGALADMKRKLESAESPAKRGDRRSFANPASDPSGMFPPVLSPRHR